jgi:hypothetical protein
MDAANGKFSLQSLVLRPRSAARASSCAGTPRCGKTPASLSEVQRHLDKYRLELLPTVVNLRARLIFADVDDTLCIDPRAHLNQQLPESLL